MKRSHWMTAAAFALAVSAPAAWAAPADESPLSWVPATAPVVIHANGPETLRNHVVAFLKNALPDQADRAEKHHRQFLEDGFEGRKLRGLAKDGPVFVVFTELPKPESFMPGGPPPHLAILVAVTSYADFRDNILSDEEKKRLKPGDGYEATVPPTGTGGVFLVDRKDFVVITPTKEMAAAFVKAPAAGLDTKLGKGRAERFLKSDLGLYVDMEAVNKEYGDQIKAAHKTIDEQLDKLEASLGTAQKSQFETVKKMIGPIFQAVEDGKSGLATLEVRPDDVTYHEELAVRAGTPTADLLKTAKTAPFADLDKLPAGQVFYVGMELDPTLLQFAGSLLTGLSTDPDAKGAKEFQEAFDDWIKAGPERGLSSVTYPIAGLGVLKCTDSEKAVAASVKMLQAMGAEGGFMNVYFKDKPEVKPNAEKYGAVSFTSIHMVWDLDKSMAAAGGPAAGRLQEADGRGHEEADGRGAQRLDRHGRQVGDPGDGQGLGVGPEDARPILQGPGDRRRGQGVHGRPQAAAQAGQRRGSGRCGAVRRRHPGLHNADPPVVGRPGAAGQVPQAGEGQAGLRRLRRHAEAGPRRHGFRRPRRDRQAGLRQLRFAAAAQGLSRMASRVASAPGGCVQSPKASPGADATRLA